MCAGILEEAHNREDIQNLGKRLDSGIFSQLCLLDADRRIKHQASMAIKLKSQGPWQPVHVVLLDNFLIWGKVKPQKKARGDRVVVLDAPIAVYNLTVASPSEQHQLQKASIFDEIPRGSVIYTIVIGDRSLSSKSHLLGALSYQEHKEWLGHLTTNIGVNLTHT